MAEIFENLDVFAVNVTKVHMTADVIYSDGTSETIDLGENVPDDDLLIKDPSHPRLMVNKALDIEEAISDNLADKILSNANKTRR